MKFRIGILAVLMVYTKCFSIRNDKYQLFYGLKTSYPQIISASVCYMKYEENIGDVDPYFQLEPGLAGNKISFGLASNYEKFAIDESFKLKLVYMNIWAFEGDSWPSKFGYIGTEIELMIALPSIHFGVYHPVDRTFSFHRIMPSFGIGIGF